MVATLLAKGRVNVEAFNLNSPDGIPVSPLMFAAIHEYTSIVVLLLRANANPDRFFGPSEDTPLLLSVTRGDAPTAKVLIDAGADLGRADVHGRSPLFLSCLMNHPECTEMLLDAGADVEQAMTSVTPGATALYGATLGRRCECCSHRCAFLLLDAGANVDAHTEQGATPMMLACENGRFGLAMILSSYGASRRVEKFNGELPKRWWARDLAEANEHNELVTWLDASMDFTPLHHVEVLLPSRARALLRSGKCSPVAGLASPAVRAKNYLRNHENDEAARIILRASQPWSTVTHHLWGVDHRAHVFELLKIGYELRAKIGHGSVLDWWIAHVIPHSVAWDIEPPRRVLAPSSESTMTPMTASPQPLEKEECIR